MNFVILIPAYRPDEKFTAFAAVLREQNMAVLVVDDGSGPDCDSFFRQAEALGCTVVRHEKNMGKGRAIKTGLQAVKAAFPEAECVITADCDGQHTAESIRTVMRAAAENPQCVILGGRFQEKDSSVPLKSRIGNDFTRGVFRLATGLRIHDTQTGLRAVPAAYIDKMAGLKGERYEYEMNMLLALREYAIPYREVPIPTIYHDHNQGTHFHPFRDSVLVLSRILKFAAASIASFVIDYLLFMLFTAAAGISAGIAYILARTVSAVFNYVVNRCVVFQSNTRASYLKYALLCIVIMLIGAKGTDLITNVLGLPSVVSKLCVDMPLFILSYVGQREFVFKSRKRGT